MEDLKTSQGSVSKENPQCVPNIPGINANQLAWIIRLKYPCLFVGNDFYLYEGGVYKKVPKQKILSLIKTITEDHFSIHLAREIEYSLTADVVKDPEEINQTSNFLNLKNGLLDLTSLKLEPHAENFLSTLQLPCEYQPDAVCPRWEMFLDEILGDDPVKIKTLQEFFGYCLTPETNQDKALMEVGNGGSGKSTTLSVLDGLLGKLNVSAVPLEQFKNPHYVAKLFGRMVNISSETNTKTLIYESIFKQLVSGELIEADHKYGHPFSFKNTCKLIFAFNTLPRVDDKTDAFYRRLIIIPFNRQIPEEKQDKNLPQKLLQEKEGILNWTIEGLKKLRQRGRFLITPEMDSHVHEYRKENNSVMSFVEDRCTIGNETSISKQDLYVAYGDFCKENGLQPIGKIKFGKRLTGCYGHVTEDGRTSESRFWMGISLKNKWE